MRGFILSILLFIALPAHAQQTAVNNAVPTDTTKFTSVCRVDSSIAWAVGSNGLLMKSIDGGITWNNIIVNGINQSDYDFQDVCFVGERRGWVVGYRNKGEEKNFGILLKTMDGSNWFVELIRSYPFVSIKMEQKGVNLYGYIDCGKGLFLRYFPNQWVPMPKRPNSDTELLRKGDTHETN